MKLNFREEVFEKNFKSSSGDSKTAMKGE